MIPKILPRSPVVLFTIVCSLLGAMFTTASAEELERVEARQDRRELRSDETAALDAQADLEGVAGWVQRWELARSRGDLAGERLADQHLMAWVEQELKEDRQEVREADREADHAQRERRRSRREVALDDGAAHPVGAWDDAHDLRDDRRDLRDERADEASAREEKARLREVAQELRRLQPDFDQGLATAGQYQQKSALLGELLNMAGVEVGVSQAELHEETAERREDRREHIEP